MQVSALADDFRSAVRHSVCLSAPLPSHVPCLAVRYSTQTKLKPAAVVPAAVVLAAFVIVKWQLPCSQPIVHF